jgi:hypothetical protein
MQEKNRTKIEKLMSKLSSDLEQKKKREGKKEKNMIADFFKNKENQIITIFEGVNSLSKEHFKCLVDLEKNEIEIYKEEEPYGVRIKCFYDYLSTTQTIPSNTSNTRETIPMNALSKVSQDDPLFQDIIKALVEETMAKMYPNSTSNERYDIDRINLNSIEDVIVGFFIKFLEAKAEWGFNEGWDGEESLFVM